ncbi:MAG TPA: peroxiredoxin [Chloroflexia bacterium]
MPSVGETAPDFELMSDEDKPVKLSDFRGKNVVLYFYPADFTSGCELQACAFRDSYADIQQKDAVVIGISPDSVDSHKKFREALNLPFTLLSDPDFQVSETFNSLGTKEREDGSVRKNVVRGQYVIDREGKIVDAQTPVKAPESRRLALEQLEQLS